jgi:hypothetical protein
MTEKINSINEDTPFATAVCCKCGNTTVFGMNGGCDNCGYVGYLKQTNSEDVDKTHFPHEEG